MENCNLERRINAEEHVLLMKEIKINACLSIQEKGEGCIAKEIIRFYG